MENRGPRVVEERSEGTTEGRGTRWANEETTDAHSRPSYRRSFIRPYPFTFLSFPHHVFQ